LAQPDSAYFGSYIDGEGTISYEIDRLAYEMETYCFAISHTFYKETETGIEIYSETGFGACAAVNGTFGAEMESQSDSIIRLEFGRDSNGAPSLIVHRDGKPDERFTYLSTFRYPGSDEVRKAAYNFTRSDGSQLDLYQNSDVTVFWMTGLTSYPCKTNYIEGLFLPISEVGQAYNAPQRYSFQVDGCYLEMKLEANQATITEKNCEKRHGTTCASWAGVYTLTEDHE
jgi:hypothetical protein